MGKKLSTFIGDSTYTRAPPNYRSPLRSNNMLIYLDTIFTKCYILLTESSDIYFYIVVNILITVCV